MLRIRHAGAVALLLATIPTAVPAGSGPERVLDLHTGSGPLDSGGPTLLDSETVLVDGVRYFEASDGQHGRELWRSDGTAEGTWLVRDISPGAGGSDPNRLTAFGDGFCFAADDGSTGRELWCSDGTAAGTRRVADVRQGRQSANPSALTEYAGRLYFAADDGVHGIEPWSTDGTTAGLQLVRDIAIGTVGSNPLDPVVAGGALLFSAHHPDHGRELWRSNGTTGGTVLVRDIVAGSADGIGISAQNMTAYAGVAYFAADSSGSSALWRSDGTAAGTYPVVPAGGPYRPVGLTTSALGVVFWSRDVDSVFYPWCSDGTAEGTVALDPAAGVQPRPLRIAELPGHVYFQGGPSDTLWRTDCTLAGTEELSAAVAYQEVRDPAALGGAVLFRATSPGVGAELFRFDGVQVSLAADVLPGTESANPRGLHATGNQLLLGANDGQTGYELWRYRSPEGAELLRNLAADDGSSRPRLHAGAGGRVFLSAHGEGVGRELWASDGTAAGTALLADADPGAPSGLAALDETPTTTGLLDGSLFYFAGSADTGEEPWRSDGTPLGTERIGDLCPGTCGTFRNQIPEAFVAAGGMVYFDTLIGATRTLWRSDGTADGTIALAASLPRPASLNRSMVGWGARLLFTADAGGMGAEPWLSDGTPEGTALLADLQPGSTGSRAHWFTPAGARAFFRADDGSNGGELWITDGTAMGTALVTDIAPGAASAAPEDLVLHRGVLYFSADDGASGAELWRSDGTAEGTWQVADLAPGAQGAEPRHLRSAAGLLWFSAFHPEHGVEPWISDGTAQGTRLLMDMTPGPDGSVPERSSLFGGRGTPQTDLTRDVEAAVYRSPFEVLDVGDGRVVFRGCTADTGCQLWISDTSPEGTQVLTDLGPVPGGAMPGHLEWLDGQVLFAATEASGQRELWKIAIAPRPEPLFGDGFEL